MSNAPRTEKEAVYDKHISPLMTQIITLCKAHRINMAAQFSLGFDADQDETLFCTTALPIDDDDDVGHERVMALAKAMRPPRADFAAFTIIGGTTR